MEYNREGKRDLIIFKSDGSEIDPDKASGLLALANASTYYAPFGNEVASAPSQTSLDSIHIKWDAAFVGSFSIETCNFPHRKGGLWVGPVDVADHDATAGNWIRETPASADVSVTSSDGTTGGATVASLVVTVAGGTAGGCMYHLGNLGSRRARVKAAVTTGGNVRISHTGKNAA